MFSSQCMSMGSVGRQTVRATAEARRLFKISCDDDDYESRPGAHFEDNERSQATGPSATHANEQQAERQQQALSSQYLPGNFTSIFGTVFLICSANGHQMQRSKRLIRMLMKASKLNLCACISSRKSQRQLEAAMVPAGQQIQNGRNPWKLQDIDKDWTVFCTT
ncbi:hypothetical protein T4B_3357 [Trichinella pseudospiralis]|uniref:Uncharacterized protein n=1 Tax=Trichinella pseudospiralis TaxID=6337 RepID=A0A0V1IIK4_TRIPS|nr:hypothetical protein T4B_3357 [Trichinella pseudospiralis]KRZ35751.1 hypothetical protein T4C_3061 [Trichinella pseudospiralis]